MLTTSIILFALAAVFGLAILTAILKSKETPKAAVYTHGLFAAIGLVLLLIYSGSANAHNVTTSIALFVIAALGGALLFARDMMKKAGPKWLAIVHALIAVSAFVILLGVAFA